MNKFILFAFNRTFRKSLRLGMSVAVLFVCQHSVAAETDIIKTRQEGFKAMGGAMKTLHKALKRDELGTAAVVDAATKLAELAPKIHGWFPTGTDMDSAPDTDALPYIWKKPKKFKGYADALVPATAKLMNVANQPDAAVIKPALGAVKDQCSGCHKSFRAD
ncbi:c-type cytochrome [Teredinibacter turnerae]|uniref:c-type cytochrome n=1 Tax=Teredinibacter turnerae TaxID=2426 RepID=UPI00037CEAAF|nr:cytochrome c [Teredinibacter turnerae]